MRSADAIDTKTECVYAVIPVFNRIEETLRCIECLKNQTFRNTRIIVADGGSNDGTREILNAQHPDVIVLTSDRTLWWGGATQLGIDWALDNGAHDGDFILLMNNDTEFDSDLVRKLLKTSSQYKAIVGAVVVDADDPDHVIDGGVTLDWARYRFSTVKAIPEDMDVKTDCDVLPGRSTLVPVAIIRNVGNVNSHKFPHYIADYEFTHRMKRLGNVNLIVDYQARVRTRINAGADDTPKSIRSVFLGMWNRRSKRNFVDHLNFVRAHAPREYRTNLTIRLLITPVLVWGLSVLDRLAPQIKCTVKVWRRRAVKLFHGPYLFKEQDCKRFGLALEKLQKTGIVSKTKHHDYYYFRMGYRSLKHEAPEVVPLYRWASRPTIKIGYFREFHQGRDADGES